jgi:peptidoglycan L-alanyl-D-glutamate endopeptidase CwlK
MKLNSASFSRLRGVHPDLVRVVLRCAEEWPEKDTGFIVTQGVRTLEEQKILKARGASRTLRSRHLKAANGYAHAVDLACFIKDQVRWDWNLFFRLATRMRLAAKKEKVPVRWGGSWSLLSDLPSTITAANLSKTFPDGPHFELPAALYPG